MSFFLTHSISTVYAGLLAGVLFLIPHISRAQVTCSGGDLRHLMCTAADIAGLMIPIAFVLALIYFFWGVAKFVFSAGDTQAIREGKYILFWGVIVMFILVSVWGIVRVLQTTFFAGSL